jgi:hypothetical protein
METMATTTEAVDRNYFGFASSAAFSTAWPVAFTSLPAPATVLHAASEKTDIPNRIASSVFMSFLFDFESKAFLQTHGACLRAPAKNQWVERAFAGGRASATKPAPNIALHVGPA